MKKLAYEITLLSSLIVSPRAGQALYKGIDEFCAKPVLDEMKHTGRAAAEAREAKVIYPFYQYGEYKSYDPKNASYYLPGSSIKGALKTKEADVNSFMADDILISNDKVNLRNLYKAQYLGDEEKAVFEAFFPDVGVEMIKGGTGLQGELYFEGIEAFSDVLKSANQVTRAKMKQMGEYLQRLLNRKYKNENLICYLNKVETELSRLQDKDNIILLGGYKGLLHSILTDCPSEGAASGLFVDPEKMLPHGLVKISLVVNG